MTRSAKVVDLNLRRVMKRIDEAGGFQLWVLDAEHRPVLTRDISGWARFKMDEANIRVAATQIGQRWVSTVFLGNDMGYGMSRQPLLFETMIFGPDQSEVADRYATWDEALAGHAVVVAEIRAKGPTA